MSLTEWILVSVAALIVLMVLAAVLTRAMVRVGMRTPFIIHLLNRLRDKVIALVKRPITIMVLDEVVDVIQTGHYTRNISDALVENHDEIKALVAEKVRQDQATRIVNKIPGYDTIIDQVSETVMRVLIEMLGDPRMDELVADLLRNNLVQIKGAVREKQHHNVAGFNEANPIPEHRRPPGY